MAYHTVSSQGIDSIPNYLSAKSVKRLRVLMRKNNLRYRGFVRYFDFQYVKEEGKEGKWFVWYYPDPSKNLPEENGEEGLENV